MEPQSSLLVLFLVEFPLGAPCFTVCVSDEPVITIPLLIQPQASRFSLRKLNSTHGSGIVLIERHDGLFVARIFAQICVLGIGRKRFRLGTINLRNDRGWRNELCGSASCRKTERPDEDLAHHRIPSK